MQRISETTTERRTRETELIGFISGIRDERSFGITDERRNGRNWERDAHSAPSAEGAARICLRPGAGHATSHEGRAVHAQTHRLEGLPRKVDPRARAFDGARHTSPRLSVSSNERPRPSPPDKPYSPQVIICMLVIDCALAYRLISHHGKL